MNFKCHIQKTHSKDNMDKETNRQTLILNELKRLDVLIKTYELVKSYQKPVILDEISRLDELSKVLYDNLDDKHLKIYLGINDSENVVFFK